MPVAPKESTYVSGPDDSLRVVDIYAAGEVLSAFEAATEAAAAAASETATANEEKQATAAKAAAVQNLKAAMATGSSDISAEQLLALGLSDAQINGFLSASVPSGANKKDLLQANQNAGVNELSLMLALLRLFLGAEGFTKLTQDDLQKSITGLDATLAAFENGSIGTTTNGSSRITESNSRLVTLQTLSREQQNSDLFTKVQDVSTASNLSDKDVDAFLNDVNNGNYTAAEKILIKKTAADSAAADGNSAATAAIAEDMGNELSPEERRRLLIKVMKNYRKPDNTLYEELPALGKSLWDDLCTIDVGALIRTREYNALHIVGIYRTASESTLEVLTYNDESKWIATFVTSFSPEPKASTVAVEETLASIY